jgi:hypothetical protein
MITKKGGVEWIESGEIRMKLFALERNVRIP